MARLRHSARLAACLLSTALTSELARAQEAAEPTGAEWELRALGVMPAVRAGRVRRVR